MLELTSRQAEIYTFIKERIAEGMPPTIREIGEHCGISSPNGVRCHLQAIQKKGFITMQPFKERTIQLTAALPCLNGGMEDFSDLFAEGNVVSPLLGAYDVRDSRDKLVATVWRI